MGKSLKLDISVRSDSLTDVTTRVEEYCDAADIPMASAFKVNLVVQELVTNSLNHADFGERKPEISLAIRYDGRQIEMLFEDNANPFDPFTESPPPDLESSISERQIGGLGIHLIRSFSDRFSYEHVDGVNRIRLMSAVDQR